MDKNAHVGQKYTTVSYKNHKKYIRDESDLVVVESAFEPIISKELWNKVQEANRSVGRGIVYPANQKVL